MQTIELHFTNPFAIFPNGFQRREIPSVKEIFRGGNHFALFQIVVGVAGANSNKLENARVTITIDHAFGAAVADYFCLVEFVDVAHGRFPCVATVKIQIPIEIKIFVPAEATEFLRLFAQMPLHFGEGFGRIHHRIIAVPLHFFDFFKDLDEFVGFVIHQARIAETQIARSKAREWITESATGESERSQKIRKFFVIVD